MKRLLDRGLRRLRLARASALNPGITAGARNSIGARTRLTVEPGGTVRLGDDVTIDDGATFSVLGDLVTGDRIYFGPQAVVSCFGVVTIGDDCRFGERVSIHDENHVIEPLSDLQRRREDYDVSSVTIGDRVWLGANVVVLPGSVIGDDVVVAAGSVVRGTIAAGSLAAGVPAVVKRALRP